MADKAVAAKAADNDGEEEEIAEEAPTERKEPINRARKSADPFADAFEAAEKEVEGEPKKAVAPKPKKARAEEPEDEEPEEKKPPNVEKQPAKKAAKDEGDEEGEEASDPDEDEADAAKSKLSVAPEEAAKKAATEAKPKGPLAAKQYWSKERREAFNYQPREVQEAWLAEAPVPHGHWSEEQKANFVKLPRDGQEMLLIQAQEIERGYGQKFQALANERKLAESIKGAVPAEIRQVMARMGLDEPALLSKLSTLQLQSMKDPNGYIRQFIATNKIDPRHIFPELAQAQPGEESNGQHEGYRAPAPQADITSHPVVHAMAAELNALKEVVTSDRKQRQEEDERRRGEEINGAVSEKDEEGNSRYPYIRLLSVPMAELLESDPERFSSMGVKEQIAEAYRLALEAFPELTPPKPPAKPAPVDEQEDEDADAEKEAEAAKLKKAATKKSVAPQSAPSVGGDPFARAFSKAERQIGHR